MSKFFSKEETTCKCGCGINNISKLLIDKVDNMRESLNRPIVLTSACRCLAHNKKIGGVDSSSHISTPDKVCKALDIQAITSRERYEIISSAIKVGITRIGIATTFIHIDIDESKSPYVTWLYA